MKKQITLLTTTALLLLSLPFSSFAQTAEERGLEIAKEIDRRDTGWGDQMTTTIMTLRNKQGDESVRENTMRTMEVEGDGDKSLIIFNTPTDVKGTKFLSHTHALKNDDQWLYLPALKRIKRVSSSNKSGPFMGSEFAYEDISSQEVEKYTYKYLKDESIDGRDSFLIERIPAYKKSGYKRQLVWVDKEYYQPLKIEFYDRKNSHLKTLMYYDYKQYLGKFWRTNRMEMQNHQTGKSTTLAWKGYKFNNRFKSRDFDKRALKKTR